MIRAKNERHLYIKQYVTMPGQSLTFTINDKLIGYSVSRSKPTVLLQSAIIITLYLINPSYNGEIVSYDELINAIETLSNCPEVNNKYKNPPIKEWIEARENWCKKVANELTHKFSMFTYDEILSDIYYTILICYKKDIYIGSLNYIKKCIINMLLLKIRAESIRISQDNINCVSLNTLVDDTEGLTLEDIIGENDPGYNNLELEEFYTLIEKLLSQRFSRREIEQIMTYKLSELPTNLYKRLTLFRYKYSKEDLYEQ